MWDVYNEPRKEALPLLTEAFKWLRGNHPSQPISSGPFGGDPLVSNFQLSHSDITTCHHYGTAPELETFLDSLPSDRPIICTEWMARTIGSKIQTHLPIFKAKNIGFLMWGLVYGKTQTIYPWGSKAGTPEPKVWFHDIYRQDGTPFDPEEVKTFQTMSSMNK